MKSLGIIGFGSFGQFIAKHLHPFFTITVFNRSDKSEDAKRLNVAYGSLEEVASKDIVIYCVPVQFLEDTLRKTASFLQPRAVAVDVSSVKVKPLKLMKEILPSSVEIIGTHPLFGPQSGKRGIEGLRCMVCSDDSDHKRCVIDFLATNLKLTVLERSAEKHDQQMAYVQALTHFIGRAVDNMNIPDTDQKTNAYQYLLDIKTTLGQDSWELFKTIEQENPFAKQVRIDFLNELTSLDEQL
ncbi:MAG: prephenate dehydrogenase/arogenate dehydrogenase family protein [Cyclobacteriaceae bacterium]